MKKVMILAAMSLAMAASSFASAGTLTQNFTGDSGNVFQIENALSVEKVANAVEVTAANGTTYTYADATGALYTKILNSTGFSARYIQVAGTLKHINTVLPMYIQCYSNQTALAYATVPARIYQDGCSLFNAIKAQSN